MHFPHSVLGFSRSEFREFHDNFCDEQQILLGGPVKDDLEASRKSADGPERPKIQAIVLPMWGADGHGDLDIPAGHGTELPCTQETPPWERGGRSKKNPDPFVAYSNPGAQVKSLMNLA